MEKIEAIRNSVEWERVNQNMPDPTALEAMAGSIPDAPRFLSASSYGATVNGLRGKGYTWNEIRDWLAKHGVDYSGPAIIAGWRTWKRHNGI